MARTKTPARTREELVAEVVRGSHLLDRELALVLGVSERHVRRLRAADRREAGRRESRARSAIEGARVLAGRSAASRRAEPI